MGYGREGDRKKTGSAPFPARKALSNLSSANDDRGTSGCPQVPGHTAKGTCGQALIRLEAANDPDQGTIYCRLGDAVIPTVTAFARYLKSLHGPKVAFERSPGYWLVRAFGAPVARYRVKAADSGLTFERVPFSKRQRAELRAR